jgi:hypothetical protein
MENQKVKVDVSSAPWVECCGAPRMFESTYMFKRISALISPTGREEYVPVEVMICKSCGKVPGFISDRIPDLPEDMKAPK